jgi:hypothetical protein
MCASAADHLHQFATGCGCDNEGNVMNGFSGRKVYVATSKTNRVCITASSPLLQLDVSIVPPFLFEQTRCSRPRCHFEMWEITHARPAS